MYNNHMHTVVETPTFQRTAKGFWSEDDIFEFVGSISSNPLEGDVIPGAKSLRKVR